MICGVDEAGRGPVIGPLVMAALCFKDTKQLKWMGVKDSKKLSAEVREELFERIRDVVVDFRIEIIEPDAIDLSLREKNLNILELETAARMVCELKPSKVIMDCPSVNIAAFSADFLRLVGDVELVMEHKADDNYLEVAAASIVAKVIRDRLVEKLRREVGVDFGSGYMSDEKTRVFLEQNYKKFPHLFRKEWRPYKDVFERGVQCSLDDF